MPAGTSPPLRSAKVRALASASLVLLSWIVTSIGVATMESGGTIVLHLRANDGIHHGHARLVYPPTHPAYTDVLKHLDGLKPGESKPVPPWPDDAVSSPARSSDSSR